MKKITKSACMPVNLIWEDICSLGHREGVEEAAEPQVVGNSTELWKRDQKKHVDADALVPMDDNSITERLLGATYTAEKKDDAAGRALDQVVDVAGSRFFFGGVLGVVTGWAIAGGVTGAPDLWQIIFQDVSSIQCYISDMILMRQQQNDFREHLRIIALLRSRSYTITHCFRLLIEQEKLQNASSTLRNVQNLDVTHLANVELARLSAQGVVQISEDDSSINKNTEEEVEVLPKGNQDSVLHDVEEAAKELDAVGDATELVPENIIDRGIVLITDVMGSIWMLIAFVIGMIVWIGLGSLYNFSNNWQLWLNTCTALQQTLSSCLLTLARRRHTHFVEQCVCAIFRKDCEVEYRARTLLGYDSPNKVVKIEWSAEHRFERVLDWYAAFVGSGYSAVGSLLFVAGWVSIGHLMKWGDNWWLIIGTWSGVVGTFNASVLRYSLYRQEARAEKEYNALIEQDKVIFNELGLTCTDQRANGAKIGFMTRLSLFTSWVCATHWAVLSILTLIIGLLIGATVVMWNEPAQLMVNSVTMIVESLFLIVLIEAHIIQAAQHRIRLHDLLMRRLQMLVILRRIEMDKMGSYVDSLKEPRSESESLKLDESICLDE